MSQKPTNTNTNKWNWLESIVNKNLRRFPTFFKGTGNRVKKIKAVPTYENKYVEAYLFVYINRDISIKKQ